MATHLTNPAGDKTAHNWAPIIELAAREVFETMLGADPEPISDPSEAAAYAFTAMVGLAGKVCGVMSVRCGRDAAVTIASTMLGDNSADSQDSVMDALGEICNMVAGNFKAKIAGMAEGCMLSVPTVIAGADYELHSLADGETLETILSFHGFPLTFTLQLHS
jgi:chemotaxis protein CheX